MSDQEKWGINTIMVVVNQALTALKPAAERKIASPSAYPLPRPKPIPSHTGNARRLKKRTEPTTPTPKPRPVLTSTLDKTTSHLSLRIDLFGATTCNCDFSDIYF